MVEEREAGARPTSKQFPNLTYHWRERHIFTERCLADPPATLETLSQVYDISRERVRQIEVRAFEKVRKHMLNAAITAGMADREKLLAASGKRAARR